MIFPLPTVADPPRRRLDLRSSAPNPSHHRRGFAPPPERIHASTPGDESRRCSWRQATRRRLEQRKTCGMLMEKSKVHEESNQIELKIKDGVSLWITKEVVQHFLGMPTGSAEKLTKSEGAAEEYDRMYIALKCAADKRAAEKNKTAPAANQEPEHDAGDGEDVEMEDREPDAAVEVKAAKKRTYFTAKDQKCIVRWDGHASDGWNGYMPPMGPGPMSAFGMPPMGSY